MELWTQWGREGGVNWEIRTDIYTLSYVKQIASGKLPYNTGSPAPHSVPTSRVGCWGRGGRDAHKRGEIHVG